MLSDTYVCVIVEKTQSLIYSGQSHRLIHHQEHSGHYKVI